MPSDNDGFLFLLHLTAEYFFYKCSSKLSHFLLVIQGNSQIKEAKMYNPPHSYCTINLFYSVTSTTIFENSWLKNQKKLLYTCTAFSIALLWNRVKPFLNIRKTYQLALYALAQFIFADNLAISHVKQGSSQ